MKSGVDDPHVCMNRVITEVRVTKEQKAVIWHQINT